MTRKQSIQHLTDLMATICGYHYKRDQWQDTPLRIHESGEAGISIDLYHFEGDGKDVVPGLRNATVRHDDGSEQRGWLFCMTYDPDEELTPLQFLFLADDTDQDIALPPEAIDWDLLDDITDWLEQQMQPSSSVARDAIAETKDIITLWNEWCLNYDDENLWLDYMVHHPQGHCNRQHLQEKWNYCHEKYGNKAAMLMFWTELDMTNRDILTEYIIKNKR